MSTDKPQPRVHDDPECKCAECVALDDRIDVALGQMRVGLRARKARRDAVRAVERQTGRHPYEREPETAQGNSEAPADASWVTTTDATRNRKGTR